MASNTFKARRAVLVGAVAVAAAVAVLMPTIGQVTARTSPEIALRFWPISSDALAAHAALLIADASATPAPQVLEASIEARQALLRQPANAVAIRDLASARALQGRGTDSVRLFHYGEAISRRDLPTQIALIELAVARGDIDEAVTHYDRALRISRSAGDILFPILQVAADDPAIATSLRGRLAARPVWWYGFMLRYTPNAGSSASLYSYAASLRLQPNRADERGLATSVMQRLVALGDVNSAARLYQQVSGRTAGSVALIRNGDFADITPLAPFDWSLSSDGGLSAVIDRRPDGQGNALILDASDGRSGIVARQVLTLPVGFYTLSLTAGAVTTRSAVPTIEIVCATDNSALALITAPARTAATPLKGSFRVPPGCASQILQIGVAGASEPGEAPSWLSDLSIARSR